jgi:hypothetical protein
MKKKTDLIAVILILLGGLGAYFGVRDSIDLLAGSGLLTFSGGLAMLGIAMIRFRYDREEDVETNWVRTYSGMSAVLGGLMWLTLAVGIFIGGITFLVGQGSVILPAFKAHPAPGLVFIGLVLAFYGGHEVIGADEERGSCLSFAGSLPKRIFSFGLLVIGVGLVAVGILDLTIPGTIHALVVKFNGWISGIGVVN